MATTKDYKNFIIFLFYFISYKAATYTQPL